MLKKFWKHKEIYSIVLVFMLALIMYVTTPYWSHESKDVFVTGTVVKQYQGGSKYLVFTSDGVFEDTDTWWYFKFNSSDIYGQLMQPGKYNISYYGFRVPFISQYPNITKATRLQ